MADEKKIDEIKVEANSRDISSKSNDNVNIGAEKKISASSNGKKGKRNILLISAASVVVCAALVCAALFLPGLKNKNGR
jgi:hypothetical protein